MNSTDTAIRKLLAALPSPGYDIGVLTDAGMYRVEAASSFPRSADASLPQTPQCARRTHLHQAHGESPYTLLDDLTAATSPGSLLKATAPPP